VIFFLKKAHLSIVNSKIGCIFVAVKIANNGLSPVKDNNTRCAYHKNCQRVIFFYNACKSRLKDNRRTNRPAQIKGNVDERRVENGFLPKSYQLFPPESYWWDMQTDRINHIFAPNSFFEDVIARYSFDRQLWLILFDAIGFIEIALRTKLIYHLSQAYGGLWYLDDSIIMDKVKHEEYLIDLQNEFARTGESFAKDFRQKHPYNNPDVWLIFEVASFGTLSKIYNNLKHQLPQKAPPLFLRLWRIFFFLCTLFVLCGRLADLGQLSSWQELQTRADLAGDCSTVRRTAGQFSAQTNSASGRC
jgi:hypothetical protein